MKTKKIINELLVSAVANKVSDIFFFPKRVSCKGLSPLTEDSLFVFEYLPPTSYTHK